MKQFNVELCTISEIKDFIETWHYSKSVNGIKSSYCFKLLDKDTIIGAMIFGGIAMANVWRKYETSEGYLIELRRLCCIDDTPKNTESYFIGKCLRWLTKNTEIKTVISYADTYYNHTGIIYRASNFEHIGITNKSKIIVYGDKIYHEKTIRTMYKGKLKPYAQKVKDALENGEAYYQDTGGKHIYVYKLHRRVKLINL